MKEWKEKQAGKLDEDGRSCCVTRRFGVNLCKCTLATVRPLEELHFYKAMSEKAEGVSGDEVSLITLRKGRARDVGRCELASAGRARGGW